MPIGRPIYQCNLNYVKDLIHSKCSYGQLPDHNPAPKTGSNIVKWLGAYICLGYAVCYNWLLCAELAANANHLVQHAYVLY